MRPLRRDTPATYRIRLQGMLEPRWSAYLDDVTISLNRTRAGGIVTTLTGQLVDQAALLGVLNNVYNLGLPLLSVECLDCESAEDIPSARAHTSSRRG